MSWGALFFAALGLFMQAIALGCAYEAYAVASGAVPTISRITAFQFTQHPATYLISVFVFGVIFGALITHFTNWKAVS
jgi:hypothetical protein